MFDPKMFDDIAKRLTAVLPPGIKSLQEDIEANFKAVLQSAFARMDLVTREEFDVQQELLQRTRGLVDALDERVQALEAKGSKTTKKT